MGRTVVCPKCGMLGTLENTSTGRELAFYVDHGDRICIVDARAWRRLVERYKL